MKVALINLDDNEVIGLGHASHLLDLCFDDVKGNDEYVTIGGNSVFALTYEFDEQQFKQAFMKLRHNARHAGRKKARIYTKDDSCKNMTWPQFVEAAQDLSQNKIIETFDLVTCRGDIAIGDETRPVSRKFLVERMAKAAEAWETDPDDTRSFLDYLNWGV